MKQEVESLFEMHIEEGTPDETPETQDVKLLSQISSLPLSSRKKQFILLSFISNFHHLGYLSLTDASHIIKPTHVNYIEHILYDPDAKENVEGDMIHKYIPTPPRNRLMYLLVVRHWNLVKYLQRFDSETHTGERQQDIADEIEFVPPPPKNTNRDLE